MEKVGVGVIGCGRISGQYLENLVNRFTFCLDVVACADIVREHAQSRAEEFGVPKVCSTDELLADPDVEIVVNLTVPAAHCEVSMAALEAGKHVYTEKALAVTRRWRSRTRRACTSSRRPRPRGCCLAARQTPFWAQGCRRAASCSTTAGWGRRSRPAR
jgi:predicted dinucleotide-utilizing enzyme